MSIRTYNKKGFLVPDSIYSMASFHAKIYPDGQYRFRIHDCNNSIRLIGKLDSIESIDEAIEKLDTLQSAVMDFKSHLLQVKTDFIKGETKNEIN